MEINHVCCYCGKPAIHQFKNGKWCCSSSMNKCPEIIKRRREDSKKQWKLRRDYNANNCRVKYSDIGLKSEEIYTFDGIHCEYGCGNEAKFLLKNGKHCCCDSLNKCPSLRKKNSEKVKIAHNVRKEKTGSASFWNTPYSDFPEDVKKRMKWSYGLTKDTDERIKILSKKISDTRKEKYAKGELKVSIATRQKLSAYMKQRMMSDPDNHPLRNIWNTKENMTYPEQLVYGWLVESNIQFESQFPWKYTQKDGSIHRRYVDFYIPEGKIFIEIDGKYWHEKRKDMDESKDQCANEDGFITYRIDPSKNVLDQLKNIFKT